MPRPKWPWLLGMLLALSLAACVSLLPDAPVGVTGVLPPGTPVATSWRAGLVFVRDSRNYASVTPRPGQIGTHYEIRPTVVQADATVAPNFSAAETVVARNAAAGLDTWLSVSLLDNAPRSTPDTPYLPAGVPTVAYNACGNVEYAPDYAALADGDWYCGFVDAVTDTFDTNANVAGYVFGAGVAEEGINTYQFAGDCSTKRASLEAVVSCQDFIRWMRAGALCWANATDKPVTLAAGAAACVNDYANSAEKTNNLVFGYLFPPTPIPGALPRGPILTPTPAWGIVYRSNGLRMDGGDDWRYGSSAPWGKMQTGVRQAELSGAVFEFGTLGYPAPSGCEDGFPCAVPTAERVGYTSDAAYKSIAAGAINLFWQCHTTYGCWSDYLTADAWRAVTGTLGTDYTNSPAAWLRFSGAVYPRTNYRSDWPEPYSHLLTVTANQEPARYCAPGPYATAQAVVTTYATPSVCQYALTTPAAPESRNVFRYPAGTTVGLDVDDRWHASSGTYTAELTYLDAGTDTLTVAWKNSGIEATHVITKTASNVWTTATFALTATLDGGLTGGADLEIRTGTGAETLYLVWLAPASGSVPTPTPTYTPSPTVTRTPTATATGVTPTATATALAQVGDSDATGSSVTLYASAPDTNFAGGLHDYVAVDAAGNAVSTMLLRFTIAEPPNWHVQAATLTLPVAGTLDVTRLELREVLRTTTLGQATWHSAQAGLDWETPGGLANSDAVHPILFQVDRREWRDYAFDVTDVVRRWVEDTTENNGWLIAPSTAFNAATSVTIEIGSAQHPQIEVRPVLEIRWGADTTPTATSTPTSTLTPLPTATATPTGTLAASATPTNTTTPPAATATPSGSGLQVQELCLNPATDLNLDGVTNTNDRVIEVVNWSGTALDLEGYFIGFGVTAGCSDLDPALTYRFPRYSVASAWRTKAIYGRDALNLLGQRFTLPNTTGTVVSLCNPEGVLLNSVYWSDQGAGRCLVRTGTTWVAAAPQLGR